MTLKNLPVYPPFVLVKVWDEAFWNNGTIPIPFADVYEDTQDLQIGDYVKLLVLSRAGNENSIELGEIWVLIIDLVCDSSGFLGKVVLPDPAVPETRAVDHVLFYPENVYDIRREIIEHETKPEYA